MNQAKNLLASAVMAACTAWPLVTFAQTSYGTTGSGQPSTGGQPSMGGHPSMGGPSTSGQPSDSVRATTGNQATPSTGSTPGATVGNSSSADRDFVANAASGGLLEVEASRLALEHSQSAEVRRFAQKMIDDHSRANQDLMAAATSAGVADVPTTLASKHQAVLNRLRTLNGAEFDREYAEQIGVVAHQETVSLFQREASEGSNPSLKSFAANTLPALRGHLQQSQAVASAAGVPMDRLQAYSPTLGSATGSGPAADTSGALARGATASSPALPSAASNSTASNSTASSSSASNSSASNYSGSNSASSNYSGSTSAAAAGGPTTGASSSWGTSRDMTTGQGMMAAPLVGPYVGGSLGLSNYSSDTCIGTCDKTDFGGKIFGGYMFTPYLGAEIDYGWFGTAKISVPQTIGTTRFNTAAEVKTDGFSGFLVGQYPVDNFRVFGKLGFARLNTSVNGSVNGIQIVDNNDPSFEFAWGVGATWMFDRNIGVRAEYEARKYKFEDEKNTLGFWSVGVQYHF